MVNIKEVKFTNPPINEVVIGLQFDAPEFSAIHYGLYWEVIKSRFPVCTRHDPIISVDQIGQAFPELPLPRVWFESKNDKSLVQLQSDRFHFNWRKGDDSTSYPGFKNIFPNFEKEYEIFSKWSGSLDIPITIKPRMLELTYINHIDKTSGWTGASDTNKILRSFNASEFPPFLTLKNYAANLTFASNNESGDLSVSVKEGIRKTDNVPVLAIELTARKQIETGMFSDWFKSAHNTIIEAFTGLTTLEAQKKWGLTS